MSEQTTTITGENTAKSEQAGAARWAIRPYREGDAQAIAAVANAAYAADKRDKALSVEEMEASLAMPLSDPPRQVLIVEGPRIEGLPNEMPAGYARLIHLDDKEQDQRIYQFNLVVHPAARGMGLERLLAGRLMDMARAVEADPATEPVSRAFVLTMVSEKNTSLRPMLEEIGLRGVRQGWIMERSLDEPIAEPQVIEGMKVRAYRRPEDNAAGLQAYNNSFVDHFEFHPLSQEMWDYMTGAPNMRLELSWLAEVDDRSGTIAGFCLCEIKDEDNKRRGRSEGWIALLGTVRGWRGKGLGRGLLLHGLHSLKSAGVHTALLGVDSESLTGANPL